MSKPLSQIISDGTLVDNTHHRVADQLLFVGDGREPVCLQNGTREKSTRRAWRFLLNTSATLARDLASPDKSKVVFLSGTDGDYEHNTEDEFLRVEEVQDENNFSFSTGNLIGSTRGQVEGYSYTLRISSRFGDEFLKYIIADADGFLELPEAGGIQEGNYDWMLIYLWLVKLKKAFRLGLPKAYEGRNEELSQPRGRLDPVQYFVRHEQARYRCSYREHSYDNQTTRLVARTLQHLDSHALLREAHTLNQTFQIATQGQRSSVQNLLATKPVRNPYYMDYNPVIALSKQILRNQFSNFGDQSQASAFFFDVSMLFEYFIRKLVRRTGVTLHSKNSRRWTIPSGLSTGYTERNLIPDLVFDFKNATYVFDVKYKSFDFAFGVSRDDLFQIHTYVGQVANQQPVGGCGFIYPIRESRWNAKGLDRIGGVVSETMNIVGRTIPFYVAFLKVPEHQHMSGCEWANFFRNSFKRHTEQFLQHFFDRLSVRSEHSKRHNAPIRHN
ncbi:MAG TPA: restriction endonuclease [Clostridia bacterium]|nr:restriction endonuclease [Clostridia bacterium]